jgi:hypothetical protein
MSTSLILSVSGNGLPWTLAAQELAEKLLPCTNRKRGRSGKPRERYAAVTKALIAKKVALALMLAAAHGAAGFDAWTTRRALQSPSAHERNPLMKPFAGSEAMYMATQGDVILPEFLMQRLPKKWKWVGYAWLAGAAGIHVAFGVQNLHAPVGGAPGPQWGGTLVPGGPMAWTMPAMPRLPVLAVNGSLLPQFLVMPH